MILRYLPRMKKNKKFLYKSLKSTANMEFCIEDCMILIMKKEKKKKKNN